MLSFRAGPRTLLQGRPLISSTPSCTTTTREAPTLPGTDHSGCICVSPVFVSLCLQPLLWNEVQPDTLTDFLLFCQISYAGLAQTHNNAGMMCTDDIFCVAYINTAV